MLAPDTPANTDPLRGLLDRLRTALDLLGRLVAEPSLPRFLAVFRKLPARDQPPMLDILEREVTARAESHRTGDGLVGPVNPLASLYVRIFETDRPMPVVSRDGMVRSTIQATALMLDFPEALLRETETALVVALDSLTPDEARALARVHADVLALIAHCDSGPDQRAPSARTRR